MEDIEDVLTERQRRAGPLLELLTAEMCYRNDLSRLVLEALQAFHPEKVFDALVDLDHKHRKPCDAAQQRVIDMLFEEAGGGTEHDRQVFVQRQHARRRRQQGRNQ